jgi:hypothetical protein
LFEISRSVRNSLYYACDTFLNSSKSSEKPAEIKNKVREKMELIGKCVQEYPDHKFWCDA